MSGLPLPVGTLADFIYGEEPQVGTGFFLTLTFDFAFTIHDYREFTLRTFGYEDIPVVIFFSPPAQIKTSDGIVLENSSTGTAKLVLVRDGGGALPAPLPPGFVLLGTGLLSLAGWRRFRKS